MDNSNLSEKDKVSQPKELTKERSSKKGIILALLILLLLLFSLGVTVFFIGQRTTFFGRAFNLSEQTSEVMLENSYLFASPLSALANGKEKIRMTIFLLDSQGRGVLGKPVFLGQHENLSIKAIQPISDNLGRVIFDISASSAADYLIEAKVDNQILPQRVRLNFK